MHLRWECCPFRDTITSCRICLKNKVFNRLIKEGLLSEAKKTLKNDEEVDKEELKASSLALFRAFRGLPRNKALIKFLSEPGMKANMLKTEAYYLQDQSKRNAHHP